MAPQTAKRNEFTRLIAEGRSIAEAARRVGAHYRTARQWLRGWTVRLPAGGARRYDPVIIFKAPVSARFLPEDERVTIADLHRRGHTARDIGTRLGRAPSTISRQLRRNRAPEGGYRPVVRFVDRSAARCCGPGAATAAEVWRRVIARDDWCRWSPSTSAPTSSTGLWPGIGMAI